MRKESGFIMEIGNFCNTGFSAVCFNYLFCWQAKKYISEILFT